VFKSLINDWDFTPTFIKIDVSTCYPLFGCTLLDFDLAELIGKATAPVARCVNLVSAESLFKDFVGAFKDELGLFEELKQKLLWTQQLHPDPPPQTSSICFEK